MIETPDIVWSTFMPEIVVAVGAMLALLVSLIKRPWAGPLTVAAGIAALAAAAIITVDNFDTPALGAWSGQIDADRMANLARLLVQLAAIAAIVMCPWARPRDGRRGEHVALILLAVCGMGLFAAAGSMVSIFVGVELFSIALYVLAALEADVGRRLEAGLKYLVLGGISSAIMLYGIALVYGATGTFTLFEIGVSPDRGPLLWVGSAMVLGGLLFKASAAPLHLWTPDVYDGAPTTTTGFMAAATKVVAIVALIRVMIMAFGVETDIWEPMVVAFAVVSIVVGNAGALVQRSLKRLLAYSSIAHAGYLLIGVAAHDHFGLAASLNYLVVYTFLTTGAFALVAMREYQVGHELSLDDLDGSGWPSAGAPLVSALPGIAMVVLMLGMAGIPPTAGFFAKAGIFQAAVSGGYAWLAVIGVLGSIISLGYYLRVLAHMYMRPAGDTAGPVQPRQPVMAGVGVFAALGVLVLGLAPSAAFEPAAEAGRDIDRANIPDDAGNDASQ